MVVRRVEAPGQRTPQEENTAMRIAQIVPLQVLGRHLPGRPAGDHLGDHLLERAQSPPSCMAGGVIAHAALSESLACRLLREFAGCAT